MSSSRIKATDVESRQQVRMQHVLRSASVSGGSWVMGRPCQPVMSNPSLAAIRVMTSHGAARFGHLERSNIEQGAHRVPLVADVIARLRLMGNTRLQLTGNTPRVITRF